MATPASSGKIPWSHVRLGSILRRVERFENRDDLVEYPFAGTYSFARGIFVGERKSGSTFALPKVQRIRSGDFVYCKIMAWEGAFGVVPPAADGCVLSGAFVVYEIDCSQVEPTYLHWFFKVPAHWQVIGRQSTGTNVRRQSLHPKQFENALIPLPPLEEQRRIVARIDAVGKVLQAAARVRSEASAELMLLAESATSRALSQRPSGRCFESVRLPDIASKVRRGVAIPTKPNAISLRWNVPTGWLRCSIAELLLRGALVDVKDGNHGSNHPRASEFMDVGTPFLTASDINGGTILWRRAVRLGPDTVGRLRVGFAKRGDVLFTHKGSIGKTAIADADAILSPQVTYYRCNISFVDARWLQYFLGSSLFLTQLAGIQEQSTRDFVSIGKQYEQFVLLPPLRAVRDTG
jgi:hypothetical protein